MSGQIAFPLGLPLPYSPESFIVHSGVRKSLEHLLQGTTNTVESLIGAERSGKTHLAVYVSTALSRGCKNVRYSHVQEFEELFLSPPESDVFLLDDVDCYLDRYHLAGSGPLVGFIEHCRARGKRIYMLSKRDLKDFDVDPHLKSRFAAIISMEIGDPGRDDIPALLSAFAAQRSLKFDRATVKFLQQRVPTSIAALDSYFSRLTELSFLRGARKINREMLEDAL